MAVLTKLDVTLLMDNVVIGTKTTRLSPLYNAQLGQDWQGHRIEAVVGYVGDGGAPGGAPVRTQNIRIPIDNLSALQIDPT